MQFSVLLHRPAHSPGAGAEKADTGGKYPAAAGRGCGVPFPFAADKANGTAVFTRCSEIFANFFLLLIVPAAGEMPNFPLFPTNHKKRKMTGIFPSLFSNTGKILKRRMKSEFFPQSLTRTAAGFCQSDNEKSNKSFQTYCFSLPPVAVGYSISLTNWDLSLFYYF